MKHCQPTLWSESAQSAVYTIILPQKQVAHMGIDVRKPDFAACEKREMQTSLCIHTFIFRFSESIISNLASCKIWETDLQKSIDFLLNPFFVFRNDLYVNLLHYNDTCCYTKMK